MSETRDEFKRRINLIAGHAHIDATSTKFSANGLSAAAEAVYAEALRDVIEAFRQDLDSTGHMSFSAIDGVDTVTALAEWRGIDLEGGDQ